MNQTNKSLIPIKGLIATVVIIFLIKLAFLKGREIQSSQNEYSQKVPTTSIKIVEVGTKPYSINIPSGYSLTYNILDDDVRWAVLANGKQIARPARNDPSFQNIDLGKDVSNVTVWVLDGQAVKTARFEFVLTPIVKVWSWNEFK